MNKLKVIYVSSYSAVASILVTVADTIGAELSPEFKAWLADFTGHHWVTKSWVSLIVFGVVYVILHLVIREVDGARTKKALVVLEIMAVLGFIAILGFYLYEFFAH